VLGGAANKTELWNLGKGCSIRFSQVQNRQAPIMIYFKSNLRFCFI
jgi:hypothetical protein